MNCKTNINNYFSIVIGTYNLNKYKVVEEKPYLQCNLRKISKIRGESHKNLLQKFRNKLTHNNNINNKFNQRNKVTEEKCKEN